MQKWNRRKDERPLEIMLAAVDLFVTNGFVSTKIDDIAKKAGVSKGTIYLYYSSKESLFKAMVHDLMLPKIKLVEDFISTYEGSQLELLRIVILQWWVTVKESGLTGVPKLIMTEADKFPDLTKLYVKEVIHRVQAILINIISSGIKEQHIREIDPILSSRVIMSSLVYFSMWHTTLRKFDQKGLKVENLIEQQIDILINGIQK